MQDFDNRTQSIASRESLGDGRSPSSLLEMTGESSSPPLLWYWKVIRMRRWMVLTSILSMFLFVLIGTLKQRPVYRAAGSLEIETPQASVSNLEDLFQAQANTPDSYLETQVKLLGSRLLTSRVVAQLDSQGIPSPGDSKAARLPHPDFQSQFSIELIPKTRLIQIALEDEDPQRAAKAVNLLMSDYLTGIQKDRSMTAQSVSSWLEDQINDTKAKLEQANADLQKYEQEHQLTYVGANETDPTQPLQDELAHAEADRVEKESLDAEAQSGDTSVLQSPLMAKLSESQSGLTQQYAQLAAKYGPNFPRLQQVQEQLAEVNSSLTSEQRRVAEQTHAEYKAAMQRESLVRQTLDKQQQLVSGTAQQILQDNILKREVDLNKQLYDSLLQRLEQAGMTSKLDTANARVIDAAKTPTAPVRPKVAQNLILGLVVGVILGVGLAFLFEHLEATFNSALEVETGLGLPLLGTLPAVSLRRGPQIGEIPNRSGQGTGSAKENWFRLDRDGSDNFELAEAIRNLRTSLLFAADRSKPRSILISSTVPSEGKTTICCNLSIALAQLGKRVLLIDGDLRRPSVQKYFSVVNDGGLVDYLQGAQDWLGIVTPSGVPGLNIITCGKIPRDPVELLSTDRMRDLILRCQAEYDFVLVDSPTLVNMADSRVLASYLDAVVLVVKASSTPRKLVHRALANVRSTSTRVIGVVLNQLDIHDEKYAYSYYSESSEEDSASTKVYAASAD